MFGVISRRIVTTINNSACLARGISNVNRDKSKRENFAYEIDYYNKQDRKLLEQVKRKTQEEVRNMQAEVRLLRDKIKEYDRDINENTRFLKLLEQDLHAVNKK